ncbi:MAG: hypothetical protein H6740_23880 [Alphaproteobacteria bacterium]|nr:hypothetical protein [Alphaproteobacteria bacterium]
MHHLRASLTSLLAGPLNGLTWHRACQQLERAWSAAPDGFDEPLWVELSEMLSAFPLPFRAAPQGWRGLGATPWSCPLYRLTPTLNLGSTDATTGAPAPCTDADLPALLASPALSGVRQLGLFRHCELSADGLRRLLGAPALSGLECLVLSFSPIPLSAVVDVLLCTPTLDITSLHVSGGEPEPAPLRRLLGAPLGQRLRGLALTSNRRSVAHLEALAALELPALRELDIGFSHLTLGSLAALLRAPGLCGLEALTMSRCQLDGPPTAAFRAARLPELRRLTLDACGLESDAVAAIAERSPQLTHLELGNNPLDDVALAALADSGSRRTLRCLRLGQQQIAQSGLAALGVAGGLEALEELDLSLNFELTALGVEALAACPLPALRRLSLRACRLGPVGFAHILGSALAPGLEELDLSDARGGPSELAAVGRATLPALRRLHLAQSRADDAALGALLGSEGLPALRFLDLSYPGEITPGPLKAASTLRALRALQLDGVGRQRGAVAAALVGNRSLHPALRGAWMEDAASGALKAAAKAEGLGGLSRLSKPELIEALSAALG